MEVIKKLLGPNVIILSSTLMTKYPPSTSSQNELISKPVRWCWHGFLTCFLPIFEFYWISFNSYINSNFGGKQSENKFDFKKEFVGWHQDLKYCGLENTEEQGGKVQMVTMWLAIDKVLYN